MKDARPTSRQNKGVPSRKFGPGLMLGSALAVAFIAAWEGGKDKDGSSVAYADKLANGLPTVCSGLTPHITDTPIIVGERWTPAQCYVEEMRAVVNIQEQLEKCFLQMPPQPVFDAATSHAWNNGVSATCGSGAMQAWNVGEWTIGCRRLAFSDSGRRVWSYVRTGNVLPDGTPERRFVQGLANRREAEYRLCASFDQVAKMP